MFFSHLYGFSYLKVLLSLVFVLQLAACSGGSGGDSANGINSSDINALNLTWTAPSEREDNSGLSLSDIAGYRIYYGVEAGNYQNKIDINDASVDQAQVANLAPGTYYVVMTTIDTGGRESSYSSEVIITL